MFEGAGPLGGTSAGASAPAPGAETIATWRDALGGTAAAVTADAGRVEAIRALEELKAAAAAAQARLTAHLDASVRAGHAARGLPAAEQGRGVGAQVALARRESPHRGGRHLGLAKALVHEMPHTLDLLSAGLLSEWRATLLVRETACLSVEDRRTVDRELCAGGTTLEGLGDRALAAAARRLAYRLDPHATVARARRAETERRVTVRPAPDTMAYLTGLLPVAQAVAAYAALKKQAEALRAAGDPRSRDQLMADLAVERLTGQATADAVPVRVDLVVTDRALLDGDDEPAQVPGYGPVPAGWARDLIRRTVFPVPGAEDLAEQAEVWLRRLYTHPSTGQLVATESKSRSFPPALRDFLIFRDQTCRTPWCDAPVRHTDHAVRAADGGPTSARNGQGMCEACNYDKDAPGWSAREGPDSALGRHEIITTTPTGHSYASRPPPLHVGRAPEPRPTILGHPLTGPHGRIELTLGELLRRAA